MEPNNRGGKKPPPKKKKPNFKTYKKNTIKSLNDFKKFTKYVTLYKLFK